MQLATGRSNAFLSALHSCRTVQMRLPWITCVLVLSCVMCGCVHALRPYNEPLQEKLRLQSPTPQAYTVQVADKADYPVGADGRVVLDVPRLERGCATYLFGIVKVSDSSAYDFAAIHVKKTGRAVRELSLNDLRKLPTDNEGYRILKVE